MDYMKKQRDIFSNSVLIWRAKYRECYNTYDITSKVKRQSMLGQYAVESESGAPLNPTGRTGLKSRGLLPHWGPNHSITVLFTRWCRAPGDTAEDGSISSGTIVLRSGKPVLQYICLERAKRFSIPWFLLDHTPTCDLNECAIKTTLAYLEQRLTALFSSRKAEFLKKKILDSSCSQTFKGFLDDHLNADNAWVETVVINFHEAEKSPFTEDLLKIFMEDNSPESIKWLDLAHSVNLRTSHDIILRTVAQKMTAFF